MKFVAKVQLGCYGTRINIRGDQVSYAMAPHTIMSDVGVMYHSKVKAGLTYSPCEPHHTIIITTLMNFNSSLKAPESF